MNLPEPHPLPFSTLISEIEKGSIKIPQFQRDFVWTKQKSCKLMDSIVKGFPIGTFIFWKTNERLRSIKNIGGIKLPEPPKGDFIQYVLDGQQRLTSLYATLKGLRIRRDELEEDFSDMFVDLLSSEESDVVVIDKQGRNEQNLIRLQDLLYGKLSILSKYPERLHARMDEYKTRISSYNFSSILIKEAPISVATEIFTRINVGGKPLSVFEIMVAKTFDESQKFDLAEKYQELLTELTDVNYDTIPPATVLQTVSIVLTKECSKKQILDLKKGDFVQVWPDAVDAIERAVDYFKGFYRVPVSRLLPYNALLVPFAYFFFIHKDKPTGDKQRFLQDFFWRCSLSGRYSSGVESKLAQDIKRIERILKGELPKYDFAVDPSPEFIVENGWFSAGRSYVKAILAIYAHFQPKSFNDNSIVQIGNDYLKQANSRNYHHFFPRAFHEKQSYKHHANHVLNITLVDDFLNKREIKTQAPSKYMARFRKTNKSINETMQTHLIDDLDKYGVWLDDYDVFIDERSKRVSREIKKRIIEQGVDKEGQEANYEDYEEGEELDVA